MLYVPRPEAATAIQAAIIASTLAMSSVEITKFFLMILHLEKRLVTCFARARAQASQLRLLFNQPAVFVKHS